MAPVRMAFGKWRTVLSQWRQHRPFDLLWPAFAFIKNNWMQPQSLVRCGFHLLRNFLLDTIALVNLFGLSLALRLLRRHNTCFYHQVSKVFYRSVVWLPSGICHRCMPSNDPKAGLFGLICAVLPIFSQVSALFNQELYTCFPWQAQSLGCPEPPLVDGGEENFLSNSPTVHYVHSLLIEWQKSVRSVKSLLLNYFFIHLWFRQGWWNRFLHLLQLVCDSVPDVLLTSHWAAVVESH